MKNRSPRRKGFTLIELLVAVLIIGILAAVAFPKYLLAVEKTRATEGIMSVKSLSDAGKSHYLVSGKTPAQTSWSQFDLQYSILQPADPASVSKAIGPFNCSFDERQRAVCKKNEGGYLYTITQTSGSAAQTQRTCIPNNENGVRLCSALGCKDARLGATTCTPGRCPIQCNDVCYPGGCNPPICEQQCTPGVCKGEICSPEVCLEVCHPGACWPPVCHTECPDPPPPCPDVCSFTGSECEF